VNYSIKDSFIKSYFQNEENVGVRTMQKCLKKSSPTET